MIRTKKRRRGPMNRFKWRTRKNQDTPTDAIWAAISVGFLLLGYWVGVSLLCLKLFHISWPDFFALLMPFNTAAPSIHCHFDICHPWLMLLENLIPRSRAEISDATAIGSASLAVTNELRVTGGMPIVAPASATASVLPHILPWIGNW